MESSSPYRKQRVWTVLYEFARYGVDNIYAYTHSTHVYYACNNYYCIACMCVVTISRINYNSFSEIPSDIPCRRIHIETVHYYYYYYNYFLFVVRHVGESEHDRI